MRLIVVEEARQSLADAAAWYEQEAGVERSADFSDVVQRELEQLARTPRRSAPVQADVRRRNIAKYPYGIFYRVAQNVVTVLDVRHHSREPVDWGRDDE